MTVLGDVTACDWSDAVDRHVGGDEDPATAEHLAGCRECAKRAIRARTDAARAVAAAPVEPTRVVRRAELERLRGDREIVPIPSLAPRAPRPPAADTWTTSPLPRARRRRAAVLVTGAVMALAAGAGTVLAVGSDHDTPTPAAAHRPAPQHRAATHRVTPTIPQIALPTGR